MSKLSTMRSDLTDILNEVGQDVTIYRPTETTGSMGEVMASSSDNYTIKCDIQPISQKDHDLHAMGITGAGDAKAYFKHNYTSTDDATISSSGFIPQIGDVIKDESDVYWRLETKLVAKPWEGSVVELKFHIRRMGE